MGELAKNCLQNCPLGMLIKVILFSINCLAESIGSSNLGLNIVFTISHKRQCLKKDNINYISCRYAMKQWIVLVVKKKERKGFSFHTSRIVYIFLFSDTAFKIDIIYKVSQFISI